MAGDVPVWPDNMALMAAKGGCLQAGVPLIYIRDFLGHSEISTTEIYARCDSEQKRKAIENTCPSITKSETPMWQKDTSLLGWLQSL